MVCLAAALLVQALGVLPADARWAAAQDVPGMSSLFDVWCVPGGACLGAGTTSQGTGGVVVLGSDGPVGAVRPVPGTSSLRGITCSPAGDCVAVGDGRRAPVVVQIGPDGAPGAVRPVTGADDLWGVACPTAATCLATGSVQRRLATYPYWETLSVYVVITDGRPGIAQPSPLERDLIPTGIACPTATTCLAVGNGWVLVLSDTGGAWSARVGSEPGPAFSGNVGNDISCPLPSTCYATASAFIPSGAGYYGVPGIVRVSAEGALGPVRPLTTRSGNARGISCTPGTSDCTVVGDDSFSEARGLVIDATRGSPTATTYWTNTNFFTGVSCVTSQSCAIVGSDVGRGVFAWKGPSVP